MFVTLIAITQAEHQPFSGNRNFYSIFIFIQNNWRFTLISIRQNLCSFLINKIRRYFILLYWVQYNKFVQGRCTRLSHLPMIYIYVHLSQFRNVKFIFFRNSVLVLKISRHRALLSLKHVFVFSIYFFEYFPF